MEPHERLGLEEDRYESVREQLQRGRFEGHEYRFLPDYHTQLERGTVLLGETAVRGFPKVPRTLVLDGGIDRHFDGPVHIEEKLNGYNTRVARIDGDLLGFLRSGRICPFTTWFIREHLDLEALFDEERDVVLCGEMIGPDNPYTVHDYPGVDSLTFRAFDLRHRERGDPWPVNDRRSLLEAHNIPQVEHFGIESATTAHEPVADIIDRLNREGREGVVLKSADCRDQLKYTTSAANQGDLAFAFSLPFDYGRAFMFRRLIREAFQSVEFDDEATRAARIDGLGEAVLRSMIEAIETVGAGDRLGEYHAVRAPPAVVDELLDHFEAMGLRLDILADEVTEGERYLRFRKVVQSSNDKIEHYLDGGIVRE